VREVRLLFLGCRAGAIEDFERLENFERREYIVGLDYL
jgi:hypothetical protein